MILGVAIWKKDWKNTALDKPLTRASIELNMTASNVERHLDVIGLSYLLHKFFFFGFVAALNIISFSRSHVKRRMYVPY